jgi:hypothetical protein
VTLADLTPAAAVFISNIKCARQNLTRLIKLVKDTPDAGMEILFSVTEKLGALLRSFCKNAGT